MYTHFLNKNDYLSIITETALSQLIRNNEHRLVQAEQAAEATICDYLTENYEIEREFNIGKHIFEYSRNITYPVGAHFYFEDQICEVIKSINGFKTPASEPYWKVYDGNVDPAEIQRYSQMLTYQPEELVYYSGLVYECVLANGFDFDNIHIPGVEAWEKVAAPKWQQVPYQLWDVVEYNGQFFTLASLGGYDDFVDPMSSECWGLIGDYDNNLDEYELNGHDYVVMNGEVFCPTLNPNADTPQFKVNIRIHDPRNYNLKRHMVQLALYELHKLISPNNVSTVRISDYDHSIQWLRDASRLKLNPQIPRKLDAKDNKPVTDWQIASFQTAFDPYNDPWQV